MKFRLVVPLDVKRLMWVHMIVVGTTLSLKESENTKIYLFNSFISNHFLIFELGRGKSIHKSLA